ncbi:hypothetical protein ACNOYE_11895 [Nannocystaceae bacterium ST9]
MTRWMTRWPIALSLALLGCPKPIDPPREVEVASTSAAPVVEVEAPSRCVYDDECPRGEICDGNECLLAPDSDAPTCGVPAIQFARGSAKLSPNNQLRLAAAIDCLRELATLELAACVEPSEDPELAERRGASVIGLLTSLGVPGERLRVSECPTSSGRLVALGRAN